MTESFDANWLGLREGADRRARSRACLGHIQHYRSGFGQFRVTDLGSGAGSALHFLAPNLGEEKDQLWRLVDADPVLMDIAASRARRHHPAIIIETHLANLADGDLAEMIGNADLVSASALLDLVSEQWITRLVRACTERNAAIWLTLSVTDHEIWFPALPSDWLIRRAFMQDQRRDKGFGMSLGVDAGPVAARLFRDAGYQVYTAPSNWRLGARDIMLQTAYLEGVANAAIMAQPTLGHRIGNWFNERLNLINQGRSSLLVGHVDLVGMPP